MRWKTPLSMTLLALASLAAPPPAPGATPTAIMAAHIGRALGPETSGERALVRFDPEVLPDLPPALANELEARGIEVVSVQYGPVDRFTDQLAETDIYIWLPVRANELAYLPEQTEALNNWLLRGAGRQIHFHWADGTRATDGLNLAHDATYDRLYMEALDIDYQALDRRQRDAEELLRSGPIHVTTPAGTDLQLVLGNRPLTRQNGDASKAAMSTAVVPIQREIELPAGAIRAAPLEASVAGRLVVPWARFDGGRVEGLRLTFEQGSLVAWSADSGIEHYEAALAAQPVLGWFREIAIGLNPKLLAPPGDERIPYYGYGAGVVRLSLGNNQELGGNVGGVGARWFFFPDATVEVDGTLLVEQGRLAD